MTTHLSLRILMRVFVATATTCASSFPSWGAFSFAMDTLAQVLHTARLKFKAKLPKHSPKTETRPYILVTKSSNICPKIAKMRP